MPLPNIYLRFKSPIILHPFLILTHQSKPICSSPSLVQLTPPTHHHIAQLIKDQKSATQAIQTFKWASKLPNFTHNQSTYRALIQKLCTFRCFDYAHQVVDEMSSSIGSNPDEDIFVTMIRGLGKARRIREVIRVLDLMHKFDCIPSLKIYNCILDVLVQEDIDIAKGFFRKKMMECGVKGDDYTYGILMKGLCLTNRIGDGFKLLQVMKTHRWNPNTTVYNTLIHALCKNGKVGRARSLMSEMIEPNDVTCNIMISAYCSEESLVQAQVLLEKSFGSGFVPDVVTVTKVIDLLCKLGRANEAAEVLDRVENNGGLVDIVAYNTLIKGFCSIGKAKVGLHFKKQMENKGCLPNVDTYNALIAGFCDIDMLDYALDLFNEMKMEAIGCNFVTYDTLIKGFCFKGQVEDGFKILEIMEESKDGSGGRISPYNSIIYGLYCEKCLDEALDFLDKMRKMFPRAVDRTMKILHFCEEGNMESAKKVYDKMVHEGGNPSVLVYTTLIHGFCQHEHIREAFELMNEMVSHGYFHVTSTYTAVISGFCRQGKIVGALKLVEDLVARGCSIDVGTYGPVIYALCSQGDLNKALKIFQQMVGKGIEPDSSTWTSLLYCLSQENSLLQTENILHVNNIIQQIIET